MTEGRNGDTCHMKCDQQEHEVGEDFVRFFQRVFAFAVFTVIAVIFIDLGRGKDLRRIGQDGLPG